MSLGRLLTGSALLFATLPGFAYTHARRGPTAQHSYKRGYHAAIRSVGQRSIDDARATQIQQALGSAGYLQGEPTGHWDSATESAMQRFQSDNGWQTKLIPDSRAIIKLGLGPRQESADAVPPANTVSSLRP